MKKILRGMTIVVACVTAGVGCSDNSSNSAVERTKVTINGAGASFPEAV